MTRFSLTDRDSLWSLILGPLVWTLHFLFVYVLAAIICAKGWTVDVAGFGAVRLAVGGATLVAVAVILWVGAVAWRRWRMGDADTGLFVPHDRDTVESRRRFTAFSAVLLAGLSLVAVLYQSLPAIFIATCR